MSTHQIPWGPHPAHLVPNAEELRMAVVLLMATAVVLAWLVAALLLLREPVDTYRPVPVPSAQPAPKASAP